MARTIEYWKQQILTAKNSRPELNELNSTSTSAVYKIFIYVVAVVMATLDSIFDLHKSEVENIVDSKSPHRLKWYRNIAFEFQYGQNWNEELESYENTGLTDEEIAAQKIINQSAVTEVYGRLRIKVIKLVEGTNTVLTVDELEAFQTYMNRRKDAGVKISCESLPADDLKLVIDVWYDPLILKSDGSRVDETELTPVPDAIRSFLNALPFNGEYVNTRLEDKLKTIEGVKFPVIKLSQAKYGSKPFANIDEIYIPDAGYLQILEANLTINYKQYVQS